MPGQANSETASTTGAPRCPHCGSSYRPPAWNREYLCPACGRPLQRPKATGKHSPLLSWGLFAAVLLGLAAGVARLAVQRFRERAAIARIAAERPPAPRALPPHFEQRLLEKRRLLLADLALAPEHPALLAAVCETELHLVRLYRDRNPAAARRLARAAWERCRRLRGRAPVVAATIESLVRAGERLSWAGAEPPGPGSPIPPDEICGPVLRPDAPPTPFGGTGLPSVTPTAAGVLARLTPLPVPPPPAELTAARVTRLRSDGRIAALRQRWEETRDATALRALGLALEERGLLEARTAGRAGLRPERAGEPYLRAALRAYLEGAGAAPLRAQRAAFLLFAARVAAALQDTETSYRLLQRATRLAPYAPVLWRELQTACIRSGRLAEARRCHRLLEEWLFPRLEAS